LAEHFSRFFGDVGFDTTSAVGVNGAVTAAKAVRPDVVVCEYDLLATLPMNVWEHDAILRETPVLAVSLTRRSDEMYPLNVNGIAGFLYLPTLQAADAHRILYAAATRSPYTPGQSSLATPSDLAEAK
jgi:hypothetical protein